MSDKSLFEQAMQGVTPIKSSDTVTPHRALKQKKTDTSSDNKTSPLPLSPLSSVSAFEQVEFIREGVQKQNFRKLKQGKIPIERAVDLHHHTQIQAERALNQAIAHAQSHGQKCIRVIHGKGFHSDYEAPVIKNLTVALLKAHPAVLAFCSSRPDDGGTGAVYVLLKSPANNED